MQSNQVGTCVMNEEGAVVMWDFVVEYLNMFFPTMVTTFPHFFFFFFNVYLFRQAQSKHATGLFPHLRSEKNVAIQHEKVSRFLSGIDK